MEKYEYGYTVSVEGESKDFVLGTCGEDVVAAKRRDAEQANRIEATQPNIKGLKRSSNSIYWVREAKQAVALPSAPGA
ncbi:hypothetical protein [Ottowia sp.]|uniref:hypothetical protein n=1 Tax=Ottowia sp. TaxID=1898956 RepID=UPI0025DB4228|nr:hypothetical protein [Ottowia sp.]MBK6616352.1 hypothetical protein [Ottowia sp.]